MLFDEVAVHGRYSRPLPTSAESAPGRFLVPSSSQGLADTARRVI